MALAEPCVLFLRRGFEAQRQGLLWLRRLVLLMVPGVLALRWGCGPVLGLKTWGIQSPRLLRLVKGTSAADCDSIDALVCLVCVLEGRQEGRSRDRKAEY